MSLVSFEGLALAHYTTTKTVPSHTGAGPLMYEHNVHIFQVYGENYTDLVPVPGSIVVYEVCIEPAVARVKWMVENKVTPLRWQDSYVKCDICKLLSLMTPQELADYAQVIKVYLKEKVV